MKKLHTLKSQFRKEMKDFKASHKSGAGTDDLYEYVSKLWCFDAFRFLADGEMPRGATSNLDEPQVKHVSFFLLYYKQLSIMSNNRNFNTG